MLFTIGKCTTQEGQRLVLMVHEIFRKFRRRTLGSADRPVLVLGVCMHTLGHIVVAMGESDRFLKLSWDFLECSMRVDPAQICDAELGNRLILVAATIIEVENLE